MSTRSIVAVPTDDGAWRGRYVHWDGYPEGRIPNLMEIQERDGTEKMTDTIVQKNYGWSYINAGQPDIEGVTPDPNAADGTPEKEAWTYRQDGYKCVAGYGMVYSDSEATDWTTSDDADLGLIDWVYVIHPHGIEVIEVGHPTSLASHGVTEWGKQFVSPFV